MTNERSEKPGGRVVWLAPFMTLMMLLFVLPVAAVSGQRLDYNGMVEKALRHAHDIRIADVDIEIAKVRHKEAKSDYYPTLSARWNSEYVRDLTGGTAQVTAVGTTVLVENTTYQNSLSLGTSYTLFDFGVRDRKAHIAAKEIEVKQTTLLKTKRDLEVRVLNLYSDLLTGHRELESRKELLSLRKELALTRERLFAAGLVSKLEVVDEALKTVKTLDAIDQIKLRIETALKDLSVYTGETYEFDGLTVSDFPETADREAAFNAQTSPEYRAYDIEMEKKRAELEAVQRGRLPQLSFYSNYTWYGNDLSGYGNSVRDVKPRNFLVGIAATLPLFDGFKSRSQSERLQGELERLRIEKEKAIAELKLRHAKLAEAKRTYKESVAHEEEMVRDTLANLSMSERLSRQQAVEYADTLTRQIEVVSQRFELTRTQIARAAVAKEMEILGRQERPRAEESALLLRSEPAPDLIRGLATGTEAGQWIPDQVRYDGRKRGEQ